MLILKVKLKQGIIEAEVHKHMEKIVITPNEVRALGNIVSHKSKNDFIGSKISQGTATVQGITSTVYTSTYLPLSKLTVEGPHQLNSDKTLTLNVTVKDNRNRPIHSGRVYCKVSETKTYSASINSNGEAILKIPSMPDGRYTLKVYYLGTTDISGSFRNFTVVWGDELLLKLFTNNDAFMKDEFTEFFGSLTASDVGVPGVQVDFYEEFILSFIRANASKKIFQADETVDVTARVSDEDGSGIAEQLVEFYETFNINFTLNASPSIIGGGGYSEVNAQLHDSDGSPIRGQLVEFYETYKPSRVHVNASNNFLQGGEVVDVYGIVADTDGSRIPDIEVKFYESFEYSNVVVKSDTRIIQKNGTAELSARLSDSNGSAIPDTKVEFYEHYELDSLNLKSTSPSIQKGGTTDMSALLCDTDGSRIQDERVDFSKTVDSTDWSIVLNNPSRVIEIDGTVDFTASVRDESNTAVSGIYVRFYDKYEKEE